MSDRLRNVLCNRLHNLGVLWSVVLNTPRPDQFDLEFFLGRSRLQRIDKVKSEKKDENTKAKKPLICLK